MSRVIAVDELFLEGRERGGDVWLSLILLGDCLNFGLRLAPNLCFVLVVVSPASATLRFVPGVWLFKAFALTLVGCQSLILLIGLGLLDV